MNDFVAQHSAVAYTIILGLFGMVTFFVKGKVKKVDEIEKNYLHRFEELKEDNNKRHTELNESNNEKHLELITAINKIGLEVVEVKTTQKAQERYCKSVQANKRNGQ